MSGSAVHLGPQVLQGLKGKGLIPTQDWLATFLASQKSSARLDTLVATAKFRLLTTDFKKSLDRAKSATFEPNIVSANVKEVKVPGSVLVQVLDIEDMGRSRWSQIEEIEADERGERTKGREIIRIDSLSDEAGEASTTGGTGASEIKSVSAGPHKLLLEDIGGTKLFAIEHRKIGDISLSMNIGSKLLLHNPTVARGVLLLEPATMTYLGGKIDTLHQQWQAKRKGQLKAAVVAPQTAT